MTQPEFIAGRYELREELGRGGFATVHRAFDRRLQREVALKRLRPDALDAVAERRLKVEALAIAALQCPGIVTIYDVLDDPVTLVLELAKGGTLADRLRRGALPLEDVVRFGRAAAEALGYAHRHGYVHRDVKPHNLLLDADGRLKVGDFGLVRHLRASVQGDGERQGLVGTLAYMSPEQMRGLDVGPASDQFSLCLVLYQCVTGWLAFRGRSLAELADLIQRGEPSWPAGAQAVDPRLRAVLSRGLAKEPNARYPDLLSLANDLAAVVQSAPSLWSRVDSADECLVGRQNELERLRSCFEGVVAPGGRGRVVLISGEAGIGKTALTNEFVRAVGHVDPLPRIGRCAGPSGVPSLVRAVTSVGGDATVPAASNAESLDRVMNGLSGIGPFLLVIEDLHETGSDVLDAIRSIVREIPSTRGLTILTFRSTEAQSAPLTTLLNWIRMLDESTEIVLQRLDEAATAELVRHTYRLEPREPFVSALQRATEGNPLFIRETLRYLQGHDDLALGRSPDQDALEGLLPERVRHILSYRVDRVEPDLRTVLDAAAITGEPFYTDTIASLLELPRAQVLAAFQRLVRQHALIEPVGGGYRFTHGKFRDVVAESVLPELRKEWHARLADILLAVAPERHAAIAVHLHTAGRRAEAISHQMLAADDAQRRIASHEARRFLSLATGNMAELGRQDDGSYHDGLVELGRLELVVGNRQAARASFETVLRLAPSPSRARGRALYNVGRIEFSQSRLVEAHQLFEEAIGVLRASQDGIYEAAAHEGLAAVHRRGGHLGDALVEAEAALRQREALGYVEGIARSRANLGAIHFAMARFADALACYEEARRYFAEHANSMAGRADLASARSNEAIVGMRLGRVESAIACEVIALAIRRRLGDQQGIAMSLLSLGTAQAAAGLRQQATTNLKEALRLARELDDLCATSLSLQVLAGLAATESREQARALLVESIEVADRAGDVERRVEARHALASVNLDDGKHGLAAAQLAEAQRLAGEAGLLQTGCALAHVAARLAETIGTRESASKAYQHALGLLAQYPEPEIHWRVARDYARWLGDVPEATRLRAVAARIIYDLTRAIEDPNLRQGYASVPERAELLQDALEQPTLA